MAATLARRWQHACRLVFLDKSFQRCNYSANVVFKLESDEKIDKFSGIPLKSTFLTESRGIFIQKGIEHLQTMEDFKVDINKIAKVSINDQMKSQGTDEAR